MWLCFCDLLHYGTCGPVAVWDDIASDLLHDVADFQFMLVMMELQHTEMVKSCWEITAAHTLQMWLNVSIYLIINGTYFIEHDWDDWNWLRDIFINNWFIKPNPDEAFNDVKSSLAFVW